MKISLSTGSPVADVWLGTMVVILFVIALLVWDAAGIVWKTRRRRK